MPPYGKKKIIITNNEMCGPWFFLQVKYETWWSVSPLSSHNNLVSFYHNTIWKEKQCDRYCTTVNISQQDLANAQLKHRDVEKLHGCNWVQWQGKKEDYVMACERKQFLVMSHEGSKTSKWT